MARITIEDCLQRIPNKFVLARLASNRAKQLLSGAEALVKTKSNKEIVTALREIANGRILPKAISEEDAVWGVEALDDVEVFEFEEVPPPSEEQQ